MNYINIFPFYQHTALINAEYVKGVPSALNKALRAGELDVSPVSSLEYAIGRDDYLILKGIGICARKEVKSVMLFSMLPIEELNRKKIFISSQSLTSVNLLKLIFSHFYKITPEYSLQENDATACMLIGDDALKEYYIGQKACKHVYDLATLWNEHTGLPFVFSLWLARQETAYKLSALHEILLNAAPHIGANAACYADKYIATHGAIFSKDILMDYWNTLYYTLSDEEYQALQLYYEMLGHGKELRFA